MSYAPLPDPVRPAFEVAVARNRGDDAFLQAVHEVFASLGPVLDAEPELRELALLERIVEPERQLVFRVPWVDDRGRVHVQRGFRVEFNGALGPYKGGLRFHPSVDLDVVKALAFEQTFKNALTGLALGGAKGGSDFDPKGRSDAEVMRFCQSFMTELHRHLGEHTDVPAGDIGVGQRELGYLFGQYRRLTNRFEAGVLTGKGLGWGGSPARKEATGYGLAYFADHVAHARGAPLEGATCVMSGSGNVALYAIAKLQQLGARVIACSDSSGALHDPEGLDLDVLLELKERRRERLGAYVVARPDARFHEGASVWALDLACDAAFPCATQNDVDAAAAHRLVAAGATLVAEGANMPCTPEAIAVLREANVAFAPGKAANAGGVAVSGLEMRQNAQRETWPFDRVDQRLQELMHGVFDRCRTTAEELGRPEDYLDGANVAGFRRVAETMHELGVV